MELWLIKATCFTYMLLTLIQHYENTSGYSTGGYMLQKDRIGRKVGFLLVFFTFLSLFFFYCIQRAYETMKQNLVKFKHSRTKKLNHLGQIKWHRKCKLVNKYSPSINFCEFLQKKLNFGKNFLWAAWGIPDHARLTCSVFWTCCKNLFFCHEISWNILPKFWHIFFHIFCIDQ